MFNTTNKKRPGSNNLNGGIKEAQAANQGDDSILPGLAEHRLNPADGDHFLCE